MRVLVAGKHAAEETQFRLSGRDTRHQLGPPPPFACLTPIPFRGTHFQRGHGVRIGAQQPLELVATRAVEQHFNRLFIRDIVNANMFGSLRVR